jgi:tetratricopeptide (TPR) repeat protein
MSKKHEGHMQQNPSSRHRTGLIVIGLLMIAAISTATYLFTTASNKSALDRNSLASSPISPVSPTASKSDTEDVSFELYKEGLQFFEAGNYADAINHYTAALAENPDSTSILNARGNAYLSIEKVEAALADFNRAIEVDSSFGVAYYNRGRAETLRGNYEAAIEDFAAAAATVPRLTYDALVNRGVVFAKMGKTELALNEYEQAIKADPNQARAFLNKATLLIELGDYASAIDSYNKAIALDSRPGVAYWGRGWAYYKLKEYPNAIDSTQKALEFYPDSATLHFNLGLALLANQDTEQAQKAYQQGLGLASSAEKAEAITDLEDLQQENPEIQDAVQAILDNLR